jgi:hypothetical protein
MNKELQIAEIVRSACVDTALQAYEHAGLSGLCEEGRWECAIQAIRELDIEAVVKNHFRQLPTPQLPKPLKG